MATTLDEKISDAKKADAAATNTLSAKDPSALVQVSQVQKTPWWSTHDAMTISASVLIFGALLIVLASVAMFRGAPAATVLRVYGMLTIIVMAVFLVVAGYDAQQMSPVIGLLGTLAGYLVGRSASSVTDTHKGVDAKKVID